MGNKLDATTVELILSILQEKLDRVSLSRIEPFRWYQIDEKLSNNPICLIFFFLLKKVDSLDVLPEEVKGKWRGYYYNNIKKNILALEQIAELQNALKKAGINFIILKGLFLIQTIYKNLGLRSFVDIDILVKEDDLTALRYKLKELGYTLQDEEMALLLREFGCDDWVFLKQGNLSLDIHWQLCKFERFKGIIKFDEGQFFQDAKKNSINNGQPLGLYKEDLFLYLSMHLALLQGFSGLHWFYDLKATIDYYGDNFDWELLIQKAKKAKLKTALYYTLYFYKKLLDTNFSSKILRCLKPSFLKRWLFGLCVDNSDNLRPILPSERGKRYYIGQSLLMDGFLNISRVFIRIFFPSREWLLYHYGHSSRLKHIFNIRKPERFF